MLRDLRKGYAAIELVVVAALVVGLGISLYAFNNIEGDIRSSASEETKLAILTSSGNNSIVNEDGNNFQTSGEAWLGNAQSADKSYLGLMFTGDTIPQGANIQKAELKFTQPKDSWISISFRAGIEDSSNPSDFSPSSRPSSRTLLPTNNSYSDNVQWKAGQTYSYDVTQTVQAFVNKYPTSKMAMIIKGTGGSWGRKFVYNGGARPRLEVQYVTSTTQPQGGSTTATPVVTQTSTVRPTTTATPRPTTPRPTATPTRTPSPTPTRTPSPAPTVAPTSTPAPTTGQGGTGTGDIFGAVTADILGTCSQATHDKYVTRGPDGKLYRTWHPAKDPSGCTFAHEHGDNPATASNYSGNMVPFGYVAAQLVPPMDEPHVGFKCFVHNKGTRNDEGGVALHDSYYCFHMGTGGAGRFTARFHSVDFHLRTAGGYIMNVQGMADTGGDAGTICDSPRRGRTVQGLGCLLDSAYEIWENKLAIKNRGTTVAAAVTSTAVFDPITSMDPSDKTIALLTWSPEARKIFKFNDSRDHYRGCDREAYSGPVSWYNRGGSQVYYTDPYGNVVDGGPLKQEISTINTNSNSGLIDQYGGLIMAYKGGNEPQTQFKYRKSACVSGLGIKN